MKANAIHPAILVLFLPFLLYGCGTTDPVTQRETLGYIPARFYDFLDMTEINLGLDSEVSLFVAVAVEPLAAGGGLFESEKLGTDGRKVGQWKEVRAEIGLGPEAILRYEKTPGWGNRYLKNAFYSPHKNALRGDDVFYEEWGMSHRLFDHEKRFFDISTEVHVVAFGINIGISPVEILDFVTGLIGLDVICDDDWYQPIPDRKPPFPIFGEGEEGEEEEAIIPVDNNPE